MIMEPGNSIMDKIFKIGLLVAALLAAISLYLIADSMRYEVERANKYYVIYDKLTGNTEVVEIEL